MKTKTIGSYSYIVEKFYINENGKLDVEYCRWLKAEHAFEEAERHIARHGQDMAFVHKMKHCIKVD